MRRFIFLLACLMSLPSLSFGQRRILERAEQAIYQFNYQEAREELALYLKKNDGFADNAYKMMNARVFGDPESPWYNPDSAYTLMMGIFYYPTTYNEKLDAATCKTYDACIDTINERKERYARAILQRELDRHSVQGIQDFIRQFSVHEELVEDAKQKLYELEFEKAKKADKLLLYDQFVEKYPEADQVGEAYRAMETLKYERAVRRNTVRDYEMFLSKYPNTKYREAVNRHILDIRWNYCLKQNDVERYREFKKKNPNSVYDQSADSAIHELQWQQVTQVNESGYYRWYMREYPNGAYYSTAEAKLPEVSWNEALETNTIEAYESYVAEFPESVNAEFAEEKIEELKEGEVED